MTSTISNSKRLIFYQNSSRIFFFIFVVLFALQFVFWLKTENIKPKVGIVPEVPNQYSVSALSLGDKQFYFRFLGNEVQNAGDSFGRFTALKNYDYKKLYEWFKLLDSLDDKSRWIPSLAAYYYVQTQNTEDVKYVVRYLEDHSSDSVDQDWWWLFQATMISESILKDKKWALSLAEKMSKNEDPNAPIWSKQMPAFLHAKMGDDCAAFFIIDRLLKENESGTRVIKPEEMDFMRYFIKYRLGSLKNKNFDPRQCKTNK